MYDITISITSSKLII